MKGKRNTYSAKFKTQVVVLELLSGRYTLNELADKHQIAPSHSVDGTKSFKNMQWRSSEKDPQNKKGF